MPLSTFALISLAELKRHLMVEGTEKDELLEEVINETTDAWEAEWGRHVVTRGAITEYHSLLMDGRNLDLQELRPRQWPIVALTSVHESTSWPRVYDAASLLVADVGYQVVRRQRDVIRRIDAGGFWSGWAPGVRTVQIVGQFGYATTAAVPARIKALAKEYAALRWREMDRRAQGLSGQSDALGNFQRFGPARITDEMRAASQSEYRLERYETAEAA